MNPPTNNGCGCPEQIPPGTVAESLPSFRRRFISGLGWLLPAAGLAIVPKCPLCVAAWIAMLSGISLSLPVANALRIGLIILCISALAFLILRQLCRMAQA